MKKAVKQATPRRGRGRPVGPVTARYQVLLEPELAAWAKEQGGLSATVRRLLWEAKGKEDAGKV